MEFIIHLAAQFAELILLAVMLYAVLKRTKKQKCGRWFRTLLVLFLFAGSGAGKFVSDLLPPLSDESLIITALGQAGNNSVYDEIFITGFTADGKNYPINEIKDGKWFWIGDMYCWRNEADTRQPDGVTRSITLSVPAGRERKINFSSGKWRGLAEIEIRGKKEIIDTGTQSSFEIPCSGKRALAKNECLKLIVYCAIFFTFAAVSRYAASNRTKFLQAINTYKWPLIYTGIALPQLFFAIIHSNTVSFWLDEIYEIGWSVQSNSLWERMWVDLVPRPIFSAFFYFWYKFAPYGERWLLLPFELVTALGIVITGLCGKQLRDGKTGMFAAFFAAIASVTLNQLSYEIRSYPFYFCFGAWLLLLKLKQWDHPGYETKGEIIKTSIIMTLFAGMHAYAVITVVMFFFVDLYRYFRYKIRLSNIIPYIIAAVSYIPILIVTLRNTSDSLNWWQPVPTMTSVIGLVNYLCGNIDLICWFLLFSLAETLHLLFMRAVSDMDHKKLRSEDEYQIYLFAISLAQILGVYIYGSQINTQATLWYNRYFIGIFPIGLNLSAAALSKLCSDINSKENKKPLGSIAALFILLVLFHANYQNLLPKQASFYERFRETGNWLYTQGNYIYNADTLVIVPALDEAMVEGWREYYLTRQGRRDPINVVYASQQNLKEILENYNRVYVTRFHKSNINKDLQSILKEQFTLNQSRTDVPIEEYIRN